jgi:hypothetical protein
MMSKHKLYPVSIIDEPLLIDKDCHIYRVNYGDCILIASSPFEVVTTFMRTRYRAWQLYLKTFYGETNLPLNCAKGMPEYDMLGANIIANGDHVIIEGEVFKVIPGYYGYYISDRGAVYSILRNIICHHWIDKDGYHKVDIFPRADGEFRSKSSRSVRRLIHHLVYMTWTGNTIPEGMCVDHLDAVIWHNYPENLECITPEENISRARNKGLLNQRGRICWTDERIETICSMLEENRSVDDIAKVLTIDRAREPAEYARLFAKILSLRSYARHGGPKAMQYASVVKRYNIADYQTRIEDRPTQAERAANSTEHWNELRRRVVPDDEIAQMVTEYKSGVSLVNIKNRHRLGMHHTIDILRAAI